MKIIAYEKIAVKAEGIALDAIIWQRFKRPMEGLLEVALDLPANQGLEAARAILPLGTIITLPIPQERETAAVPITSLWD